MHAFFSPDNSDREPATGAQPARTPQAEDGTAPVAGPTVRITWGANNTWDSAKQSVLCLVQDVPVWITPGRAATTIRSTSGK